MSLNEELLDRAVRHAIYLERLTTREVNEVLRFLSREVLPSISKDIAARVARIQERGYDTGAFTTKRYKNIEKGLKEQIRAGMRKLTQQQRDRLPQIAMTEAEWQARIMRGASPISVDLTLPSMSQINEIIRARPFEGRFLSEWYDGLSRNIQTKLTSQMRVGLIRGETTPYIISRVREVYDAGARETAAIVRTSIKHVANATREAMYQENDDFVKKVMFVATLDDRTTQICASLDGKEFDINDGPRPPMHFNCRSTTVPVVMSWKELGIKDPDAGTRASMDGYVPEKLKYQDWLRKQPKSVQEEVLGVKKAELFRKEKISIDKFVDNQYNVLTLEELRAKEGLDV